MDLPIAPHDAVLTSAIAQVFDLEGRILRALDALGPLLDRDVLLLDGDGGRRKADLERAGARVRAIDDLDPHRVAEASADVVIGCWTGLGLGRVAEPATAARLERVLRAEGRLLLVEDYGRDDLRPLYADPEREARLKAASDRRGPMLGAGFRTRTLHCAWSFPSIEAAADLLTVLFPETAERVVASLSRPRLEHKVAVFHRTRSG